MGITRFGMKMGNHGQSPRHLRCYVQRCRVTAKMFDGVFVPELKAHTHAPDPEAEQVDTFKNNLRHAVITANSASRDTYDEVSMA